MNNGNPVWLQWAMQIQAISQSGLAYSKDVYDIERFEQLRLLSLEIMSAYTDVEVKKVRELFANETGYATPKVDVRSVVFQDGKILMVREKLDGAWSLPGGWADIGFSPGEVAVKETQEESGFLTVPTKLLAVLDKAKHRHPPSPFYTYKIFIQCEIVGGHAAEGTETSDVRFFAEGELPELSPDRITEAQIKLLFEFMRDPQKEAVFE